MTPISIPIVPNSPLRSLLQNQPMGKLSLRCCKSLNFIENQAFDQNVIFYDDNYQNSQSHSPSFQIHMEEVLKILKGEFPKGSRLVEVGCGKGEFVELTIKDGWFNATGYDSVYEGSNPSIAKRYLTEGDRLEAEIVVLRHVLEHIQAPHRFLALLKKVFGSAHVYIEVPNYDWIVDNRAFYDITYEHVNYFTSASLLALFDTPPKSAGLFFENQYQFIVGELSSLSLNFERHYESSDWKQLDFYELFPDLDKTCATIASLVGNDANLFVWGAATKGCMFLLHASQNGDLLGKVKFAIDVNPHKCGKFLPGSLVPIKDKGSFFDAAKPNDVLVISNPNYRTEILSELKKQGLEGLKIVTL
jgi:hypothetical protein